MSPDGVGYVAELFGGPDGSGQISKVVGTGSKPVIALPAPAALEWHAGKLYASQNAPGGPDGGQVVTFKP